MIILTKNGFDALIKQIHRRLPKSGGKITGNLVIEKNFEVKGHAKEQLASYPNMSNYNTQNNYNWSDDKWHL